MKGASAVEVALTLLVAAGCASAAAVDTDSAMVAWAADRACTSDAECVIVEDCCACSAGGGRVGVNARARAAVEARRAEACSTDNSVASPGARRVTPVTCNNVPKRGGSCAPDARAACRAGVCRVLD
jgi:hypothetical protein